MKYKIVFLIFLFCVSSSVQAMEGKLNISCEEQELEVSESTLCTITGTTNEEISGLQFHLIRDKKVMIEEIKTSSIWEGDGEEGHFGLYTDENKKGDFAIGTFRVTAKKGGTVKIGAEKISVSSASFELFPLKDEVLTIKIKGDTLLTKPIFLSGIVGVIGGIILFLFFLKRKN